MSEKTKIQKVWYQQTLESLAMTCHPKFKPQLRTDILKGLEEVWKYDIGENDENIRNAISNLKNVVDDYAEYFRICNNLIDVLTFLKGEIHTSNNLN